MLSFLAAPGFQPFSIAGAVLLGLLAIELLSLMVGHSFSAAINALLNLESSVVDLDHAGNILPHGGDINAGTNNGGIFSTAFDWLNAGRVPLLVLIMAALASFAVVGLVIQIVALHVWTPLPATIVSIPAFLIAIPVTRWASRQVARIMPRDESYVVTSDGLIGRTGIVTLGPVMAGAAARAKIQDQYGNWHFPRIRPAQPDLVVPEGAHILVVDRKGNELLVVLAEGRLAENQPRS
jgi:membrane protein implicated in regulation of membrane protease activity